MLKKSKKETVLEAAKKYVDQQLETMKSFNAAPRLSQKDYQALIKKVAAASRI